MTERQHNMLSEMKRGIKEALEIIEADPDIEAVEDTLEEMKAHYIGKLYQLSVLATLEAWYEKNG